MADTVQELRALAEEIITNRGFATWRHDAALLKRAADEIEQLRERISIPQSLAVEVGPQKPVEMKGQTETEAEQPFHRTPAARKLLRGGELDI